MSPKQELLRSEIIIERYGKALSGKTVLITGVSGGSLAGELALQLSSASPARLILSARSESRVAPIVDKIKADYPEVATSFLKMDLSDLSDIRRAAESLNETPKIDHLLAVAGIMVPPYGRTVDGVESQFGVNYLANFLLVKLLLPKIRAAGTSASIVIMASSAVTTGKDGQTYDAFAAYCQSNAARVMLVKALAEKLQGENIRVFSIDPGMIQTGLQRHFTLEFITYMSGIYESGEKLRDLDGKEYDVTSWSSASEGAATVITAMVDPTIIDSNGAYLHNNAVAEEELHSHIRDRDNWRKLWDLSEKLTGEKFSV